MPSFVLEIGTEEIPARFLPSLEAELVQRFSEGLEAAGVAFAGLAAYSTPRRCVVHIAEVAETAVEREEVLTGPPMKSAYDVGGRPTRAAEGFVRTHGVRLEDAFTLETEKGAYLAVRKKTGGGDTRNILTTLCPSIIAGLPFPKKMRWGSFDFGFGRPLRWVLALFGDTVLTFSVGPVTSGNTTRGHRVHGPGPFIVPSAEALFPTLRDQGAVVLDAVERRRIIREKGDALAAAKGGRILWNETLLDEVQGLCEHPVPILGGFDPAYLEVPRQVLLTSMQSHQKSFGVETEDSRLLPFFLTVLNLTPPDEALVRKGWERVLRARLEDARFFWKTDLASGLAPWQTALDNVIFLAPLGSMGGKTRRLEALCAWLTENLVFTRKGDAVSQAHAARAGLLSKVDLVSEMVKEFDTLQGIMGGIYARKAGEPVEVAEAVAEQYLPAGPDSPTPGSLCGAILSMADRADTLAGCFGLNMVPTGAADPYGLRRAALGIVRILQEKGLRLDVSVLFAKAVEGYGETTKSFDVVQTLARLEEFFALRLKNYFVGAGAETLHVEAVLGAGYRDVLRASERLAALSAFSKTPDYDQAVLTFKRAANIIRKQGQGEVLSGCYDRALLAEPAEKALADELARILPVFEEYEKHGRYPDLFVLLKALRPTVDAFFDGVMVMAEDPKVRANRLNLLQALVAPLSRLADFAALQM